MILMLEVPHFLFQFHDGWKDLLDWLDESEKIIDADTAIASAPDKIKAQIIRHKEFQRMLGAKQPTLDSVVRLGRNLKDRSPKPDHPVLQEMINELKTKWNSICAKSVDRYVLIDLISVY